MYQDIEMIRKVVLCLVLTVWMLELPMQAAAGELLGRTSVVAKGVDGRSGDLLYSVGLKLGDAFGNALGKVEDAIQEYKNKQNPFYYLSGDYEEKLRKEMDVDETESFTRSGYQVVKYASISGAAITGLVCVIVWMISPDPNKRAEKRRALMKKCLLLVGVFSASWLLSSLFNLLSLFR